MYFYCSEKAIFSINFIFPEELYYLTSLVQEIIKNSYIFEDQLSLNSKCL